MDDLIMRVGGIVVSAWGLAEAIGRRPPFDRFEKALLAVILGPLLTVTSHATGFQSFGDGWRGWIAAALVGLVATILAGSGHDKVVKPILGEPLPKGDQGVHR